MVGRKIAHYSVTSKIGQGGMGEVYRATDSRLGREVALKLLPEAFTGDAQRMGRFSREARVLASLNHINIASIYGFEEAEGTRLLIMELVEGEDLSERISRGPMPLRESLEIALQIAGALESAHEKGVVHRDLKPANVKITPDGRVKVLDFGLAKALEAEKTTVPSDLSHSPTLSFAATQAGIILGTAGYMSPEQARGATVDQRSDTWSFGVILVEMLSGKRVFSGDSLADTLAAVIKEKPDWSSLPAETPSRIRELLKRCLEKDPAQRLQAIGEARICISRYLADAEDPERVLAPPSAVGQKSARRYGVFAAAFLALLLAAFAGWSLKPGGDTSSPLRVNIELSEKGELFAPLGPAVTISPDGTRLAYVLGDDLNRNLYLRSLNQFEGSLLTGTEGAYHPFFSADGQWIAFFTRSELKKVSVSGGTPLKLCDVNLNRGGTWGPDNTIVFAATPNSGLFRVPATGGSPQGLTGLESGELSHRWPQFVPGGHAVVFTSIQTDARNFDQANIEALDLETGQRKVLQRGGSFGRILPTGHLVFLQNGTLFAAPFDSDALEMNGAPAPVLENIMSEPGEGGAQIDFSETGLLAYIHGTAELPRFSMLWVDRNGLSNPVVDESKSFAEPRFSPQGDRLAVQISSGSNTDAWVFDLVRGVSTRLTFDDGLDFVPVWSPDGRYLAYSSDRDRGPLNIYRKLADGTGEVERLTDSETTQFVSSWSPDGEYLLFTESNPETSNDLMTLSTTDGEFKKEVFLATPFQEGEGAFSPDGRWVAYQSNESGQVEIYVRPFRHGQGKWQISTEGGAYPRWSKDRRELYYRKGGGLMAVSVRLNQSSFQAEKPRRLFDGSYSETSFGGFTFADYDPAPDGRFVMFRAETGERTLNHVNLITNWFRELKRMIDSGS